MENRLIKHKPKERDRTMDEEGVCGLWMMRLRVLMLELELGKGR